MPCHMCVCVPAGMFQLEVLTRGEEARKKLLSEREGRSKTRKFHIGHVIVYAENPKAFTSKPQNNELVSELARLWDLRLIYKKSISTGNKHNQTNGRCVRQLSFWASHSSDFSASTTARQPGDRHLSLGFCSSLLIGPCLQTVSETSARGRGQTYSHQFLLKLKWLPAAQAVRPKLLKRTPGP